jgi:cytochrome c peroxidase
MTRIIAYVTCLLIAAGFVGFKKRYSPEELLLQKKELGRQMFFDKNLSNPNGQSCTVCHAPKTAFSDPDHAIVSEGMLTGFFVNRNSQSLTYSSYSPPLHFDEKDKLWRGGLFWDGRSNTLQHQLSGPFFNPAEMNNADTAMLVAEVKNALYYKLYKSIYGKPRSETEVYNNMTEAISILESSDFINEFSSKYDDYLAGKTTLTEQEERGRVLFEKHCSSCHNTQPQQGSGKVLFTDFSYYNLGVPRNEDNPFYTTDVNINPQGKNSIDKGLGAVVKDEKEDGKFRTPTLRNVEFTAPYFHNGYAATLKDAIHFINTRQHGNYEQPEIAVNLENKLTGNMGLTQQDEEAIEAFLNTLSDAYLPK